MNVLPTTVYTDSLGKAYRIHSTDSSTIQVEFWGAQKVERINLYFSHPDKKQVAFWFQQYQRHLRRSGYRAKGLNMWQKGSNEVYFQLWQGWGIISFTYSP